MRVLMTSLPMGEVKTASAEYQSEQGASWRAFPIFNNPTCRPSTASCWRGRSRSTARWPTARRRRRRCPGSPCTSATRCKLDPRLRELAILQVGYLTKQAYEYSHHVKIGREFGVSDDDIRAIGEETAGRPTKLDALSRRAARRARDDRRSRHVGWNLRRAGAGARPRAGHRPDAGDRLLQRRGPAARHAADRRRAGVPAIWKSIRCRANNRCE